MEHCCRIDKETAILLLYNKYESPCSVIIYTLKKPETDRKTDT